MSARTCPRCRLLSPGSATRCDCGYDFALGSVAESHLTTSERLALDDRIGAGPLRRWVGWFLDQIVTATIAGAIVGARLDPPFSFEQSRADGVAVAIILAVWFFYYLAFETVAQRTIGKIITGTRVVTEDGGAPEPLEVFVRTLTRFIPLEAIGVLTGRALHDVLSRTRVVIDVDGN